MNYDGEYCQPGNFEGRKLLYGIGTLTSVNRRTVDKMFHYIHSFPLDEYDVELIRKDIIGMAMEGEQRNEPFI